MKDLRERCEKLLEEQRRWCDKNNCDDSSCIAQECLAERVEAFAREILEEAACEAIRYAWREGAGCADAIRAIALVAAESEK